MIKKLKKFRDVHGLTKADMARLLNVPYRTYQDWELGNKEPSAPAISLIKMALGSSDFLKRAKALSRD